MKAIRSTPPAVLFAPLVALLLLLLGWRGITEVPQSGLDFSWQAALHMAAHSNFDWGTDLAFTYGPLGWLRSPTDWYTNTGGWALVYLVITRLALFSVLWLNLRRHLGSVIALVLLLPTAWLVDDASVALAFAAAVWLVAQPHRRSTELQVSAGLGLLAGLELLGKINSGVTALMIGGLAVMLLGGGRRGTVERILVFGSCTVTALLIGWLAAGQPLGALPDYAGHAAQVVGGYSSSMQLDQGEVYDYWLAALVTAAGFAAIWWLLPDPDRRSQRVLSLLWLVWTFLYFKAAFVRHDGAHTPLFFEAAAVALAAFPVRRQTGARVAGALLVLLAPACALIVLSAPVGEMFDLRGHADLGQQQLSSLWNYDRRRTLEDLGRATTQQTDAVPPSVIAAATGHTTTVEPDALTVVWANGLRWQPEPVFQGYQAYTKQLDALNAKKLLSPSAPERILVIAAESIDGRLASFDTPASARAKLCRYRPSVIAGVWIALARSTDRCTPPRLVGATDAAWGQKISVPPPSADDALVYARIDGADVRGVERLRSLFFKAHIRTADLGAGRVVRIVPGVLGAGLPLLAGKRADFPRPFSIAANAPTITLNRSDRPQGGTPLHVAFYEIHVKPDTRATR